MLRSVKGLQGCALRARDGEIGVVEELYFDEEHWTIRYLVVNTGDWLVGRRVLVSPAALEPFDPEGDALPVNLTREQVENAPYVDTHRPISRQWEMSYYDYYGWPYYWRGGPGAWGYGWHPASLVTPPPGTQPVEEASEAGGPYDEEECRLRSTREVTGYGIEAADGDIGHVEDFILDDETWEIRYLSIDTRNWWPGKKVLVPPRWIRQLSWADRAVVVDLTRDQIRRAPEWDPSVPLTRDYEEQLYRHYDRPRYWHRPGPERRAA